MKKISQKIILLTMLCSITVGSSKVFAVEQVIPENQGNSAEITIQRAQELTYKSVKYVEYYREKTATGWNVYVNNTWYDYDTIVFTGNPPVYKFNSKPNVEGTWSGTGSAQYKTDIYYAVEV